MKNRVANIQTHNGSVSQEIEESRTPRRQGQRNFDETQELIKRLE